MLKEFKRIISAQDITVCTKEQHFVATIKQRFPTLFVIYSTLVLPDNTTNIINAPCDIPYYFSSYEQSYDNLKGYELVSISNNLPRRYITTSIVPTDHIGWKYYLNTVPNDFKTWRHSIRSLHAEKLDETQLRVDTFDVDIDWISILEKYKNY
jgi:hypothetical protein